MGTSDDTEMTLARQGETIPPSFNGAAFHCVYCAVYTTQKWVYLTDPARPTGDDKTEIWRCTCQNCQRRSYWIEDPYEWDKSLPIHPIRTHLVPPPHPDLPPELRADYEEAATILDRSPRGAGALMRLLLQRLMPLLGETGGNINADIGSLVSKGLDPGVQQALDALRVIGNNAVHPLELDLEDDIPTVAALFGLVNFIVEQRIAHPRKLGELYDRLPQGAKAAIARRDGGN